MWEKVGGLEKNLQSETPREKEYWRGRKEWEYYMQLDDVLSDRAGYSATTLNSFSSTTSTASPEMQLGVSGACCCVRGESPHIGQERNAAPMKRPQQRQHRHQKEWRKRPLTVLKDILRRMDSWGRKTSINTDSRSRCNMQSGALSKESLTDCDRNTSYKVVLFVCVAKNM